MASGQGWPPKDESQNDGREEAQLLRFTLGQLVQHLGSCFFFFSCCVSSDLGQADISWQWMGF